MSQSSRAKRVLNTRQQVLVSVPSAQINEFHPGCVYFTGHALVWECPELAQHGTVPASRLDQGMYIGQEAVGLLQFAEVSHEDIVCIQASAEENVYLRFPSANLLFEWTQGDFYSELVDLLKQLGPNFDQSNTSGEFSVCVDKTDDTVRLTARMRNDKYTISAPVTQLDTKQPQYPALSQSSGINLLGRWALVNACREDIFSSACPDSAFIRTDFNLNSLTASLRVGQVSDWARMTNISETYSELTGRTYELRNGTPDGVTTALRTLAIQRLMLQIQVHASVLATDTLLELSSFEREGTPIQSAPLDETLEQLLSQRDFLNALSQEEIQQLRKSGQCCHSCCVIV